MQANKVFKKLGLKEDGLVTVDVVRMAPCVNRLREVGAVCVEAFALACLNH
jgi:hypothetical protein